MPEWLLWTEHFISAVGFPIFVACFLLYRDWKVGKKTNDLLTTLIVAVEAMEKRL